MEKYCWNVLFLPLLSIKIVFVLGTLSNNSFFLLFHNMVLLLCFPVKLIWQISVTFYPSWYSLWYTPLHGSRSNGIEEVWWKGEKWILSYNKTIHFFCAAYFVYHVLLKWQADLWSVGVIFYQLVTGKTPFTANNQIEVCLFSLLLLFYVF